MLIVRLRRVLVAFPVTIDYLFTFTIPDLLTPLRYDSFGYLFIVVTIHSLPDAYICYIPGGDDCGDLLRYVTIRCYVIYVVRSMPFGPVTCYSVVVRLPTI